MKPSILIIYTGGTIGMKPDPTTGALVPFDFSGIFEEFPTLQSLNIGIEVFTMDPVIDSSNVSPRNWLDLAAIIRDNYARYDGFVVLHGTDTMSYTASALTYMLQTYKLTTEERASLTEQLNETKKALDGDYLRDYIAHLNRILAEEKLNAAQRKNILSEIMQARISLMQKEREQMQEAIDTRIEAIEDESPLNEAERAQLDVIRRELGTQFCRRCNYCQPCTAGIAISGIFVLEGYLNRYGLGDWAKQRYAAMGKKAGDCVGCGACEKRCPYQLPIRQMLARCKDEFGA